MTPLNPILGHSELTKQKLISLYAEKLQVNCNSGNEKIESVELNTLS